MKIVLFTLLLSSVLGIQPVVAQDTDYLTYAIPQDAIKLGPSNTRPSKKRSLKRYSYFIRLQDDKRGKLVGSEYFSKGKLVARALVKDGEQHGLQKTWYENGQLASEYPYNNGVMDGTFRIWDEAGRLITQYRMEKGTGLLRQFDKEGVLLKEARYENNVKQGLSFELYLPWKIYSFAWYSNNYITGKSFAFFENGDLHNLGFFNEAGLPHGPSLTFDRRVTTTGTMQRQQDDRTGDANKNVISAWFNNGEKVDEEQYAKQSGIDPTLPAYFKDTLRYTSFVTPEISSLFEQYLSQPKAKIPLEFDAQGEPLPALPPEPLKPAPMAQ